MIALQGVDHLFTKLNTHMAKKQKDFKWLFQPVQQWIIQTLQKLVLYHFDIVIRRSQQTWYV